VTRLKIESKAVVSLVLAALLFVSGAAWQNTRAQAANASPAVPAVAGRNGIAALPPSLPPPQAANQPAALSSTLSYYFISGNTFVADTASTFYFPYVSGCMRGMPAGAGFWAPVHLPQASVVVSVTLYTYETIITTTVSTAYFFTNNGLGFAQAPLSVNSAKNTVSFQHQESTGSNPTTIDNQNDSYTVLFAKAGDSTSLSLCGVRLSYYAPVSATFLPDVLR